MASMTRATLVVLLALASACASSSSTSRPRSSGSPPPRPTGSAGGPNAVPGQDAVEDAYALWTKMRGNAEKALAAGPGDPNSGWLERALESDGRALLGILARPEFDSYAAERDELRARMLFVIKPPAAEDRREAVRSVEESFAQILKRRRGPAPASG
jgi:hypothetical protein